MQSLPGELIVHGIRAEKSQEALLQCKYNTPSSHACLLTEAILISHGLSFQLGNQAEDGRITLISQKAVKQDGDKMIEGYSAGGAGRIQQKYTIIFRKILYKCLKLILCHPLTWQNPQLPVFRPQRFIRNDIP